MNWQDVKWPIMDVQFNIENFGRNLLAEARRLLAAKGAKK